MKEEGMKGAAKEVKKNYFFITTLIICVVSCGFLGWSFLKQSVEFKSLTQENTPLNKKPSDDELLLAENAEDEDIKDNDDLLKRDVFLYIDKKFQMIPKIVALDIAEQILKYSKIENVSPILIVGIIEVESGFNPMAISSKNARGLMQVMPVWAKKFGLKKVSDLHDIDTGIKCGIKVLKIHIDEQKGDISRGLYYYVGKNKDYSGKVYQAMGKFVAFRSTIDNDKINTAINTNRENSIVGRKKGKE